MDYMITYYLAIIDSQFNDSPQFLFFIFKIFLSKITFHLCRVLWTFTQKSVISQVATLHLTTGFTKIISGLRSVSTLHQLLMNTFIFIWIIIQSVITMCYFERRLSFKHIQLHKFTNIFVMILFHLLYFYLKYPWDLKINIWIMKYHICLLMVLWRWLWSHDM